MIIYTKENNIIKKIPFTSDIVFPEDVIWFDILNLKPEEEEAAEKFLQLNIPSREEMREIEITSRFYQKQNAVFMTATLVTKFDSLEPESHIFTFILVNNRLITVRYAESTAFRQFISDLENLFPAQHNGTAFFVGLIENMVERSTDILEFAGKDIDKLTKEIFSEKIAAKNEKHNYKKTLEQIGVDGDLISKTRESLVSLRRMISYALQSSVASIVGENKDHLTTLLRDISVLSDHASFLSNKINFLLDATLGMIGIEQNNIIKIFSVAAVVFLPPTLIASIYGMNFHSMPELKWFFGYPFAIMLMMLSAWLPYKFFKKRNWL